MKNRQVLRGFRPKMVVNEENFMCAFRQNLDAYISHPKITLNQIAEEADVSNSTLHSLFYGNDNKGCSLSTAVKLAKALGISIDELTGAGTIADSEGLECIAMYRELPDYVQHLIVSFVRHQHKLHTCFPPGTKNVPVLLPECCNGYLRTTNLTDAVCIDNLTDGLKARITLGIKIPCEHFEPHYMPGEIVLLGADRCALNDEKCVVVYRGYYYLAKKNVYMENGKKKVRYVSLLDSSAVVLSEDVEERLGYVVGFLNPDGTWGIR